MCYHRGNFTTVYKRKGLQWTGGEAQEDLGLHTESLQSSDLHSDHT